MQPERKRLGKCIEKKNRTQKIRLCPGRDTFMRPASPSVLRRRSPPGCFVRGSGFLAQGAGPSKTGEGGVALAGGVVLADGVQVRPDPAVLVGVDAQVKADAEEKVELERVELRQG